MTREPVRVDPGVPVRDAVRLAHRSGRPVHHLLVVRGGDLLGIVCVCALASAPATACAGDCLRGRTTSLAPTHSVREAIRQMRSQEVEALPVVQDGRLLGLLTRGDLLRAGVPDSALGPLCSGCGTHHHIRAAHGGAAFCADCLGLAEKIAPFHELYEDIGVGD